MKQPLRSQWTDVSQDAAAELAAAAETEQGLEDFADLFAAELNQLQQEQQPAPRSAPSANKRRRSHRELVSINFGSQDAGSGQAADAATTQEDDDVDLITPPWLQPKTKAARKDSNHSVAGSSRLAQHTAADEELDAEPAQGTALQQHVRQVQHQGRPPQRTPPAKMQPPPAPVPAPAAAAAAPAAAAGHAAAHAPSHAPGHAADSDQDEDVICDNSSDDFEPPSSTRRVAARAVGTSAGKRPGSGHRPASGAARTPGNAGTGRLLDSLLGPSPGLAGRANTQQMQRQQQQQQQQFRTAGAAADGSSDAWVPPKYKQPASMQGFAAQHTGFGAGASQHPQQQYRQQRSSTQRPPGLLERQQPAMAAVAGAGGGQLGAGAYGVPGPCTAGGADVGQAWWWVLPDFVPVEVLLQQQCNPRDGTPVYINYKSQFKDGGTAAAPEARTAAKQAKGKGKRGAAAAPGPTGFMTAAWLDQQQGKGSGGRSKGRKRRSRKAKGAEGGSGGSSGSRRKRGSGGGRWSTVNGQKVFISNNGSRLTGSSAYKAYKGNGK